MEITWLGHGTVQFRLPSGETILMDPWTEGNPAYPRSPDTCSASCRLPVAERL
jgi:L-ascorbate metabolism protein UlaG (beta-lactamase superfamily)